MATITEIQLFKPQMTFLIKSQNIFQEKEICQFWEQELLSCVNILRRGASRDQPLLMAAILQMGPLSSSAVTTPFVFAEGGQPFKPTGRIIASLVRSPPSPLPAAAPSSHKIPHFNCVPWKPVGEEEEKLGGRREKKELYSGQPVFIPGLCIANNKLQTTVWKKEAQRSKAVEDWPTGLQFSSSWLL